MLRVLTIVNYLHTQLCLWGGWCRSSSLRRREAFQLFEPVEDQVQLIPSFLLAALDHQKVLAVRRHVIGTGNSRYRQARNIGAFEELYRSARAEDRAGLDRYISAGLEEGGKLDVDRISS